MLYLPQFDLRAKVNAQANFVKREGPHSYTRVFECAIFVRLLRPGCLPIPAADLYAAVQRLV